MLLGMNKLLVVAGLLALTGHAQGQVLGRAIALQQTGICRVLGCAQLKEVQVSPRIKYVEGRKVNVDQGREAGGGVAAFYVDGKLAALGWQDVAHYDSLNISAGQLDRLTEIAVGTSAPAALKTQAKEWGLDLELGSKTFPVKNAVFKTIQRSDRRGILLIDQRYFGLVSSAVGRDDRKVGAALLKDFFRKNGIKADQLSPYRYRVPYTAQLYSKAQQYFVGIKKMENHACCGHPGQQFTFQGLSATQIDVSPDDRDNPRSVIFTIENM